MIPFKTQSSRRQARFTAAVAAGNNFCLFCLFRSVAVSELHIHMS